MSHIHIPDGILPLWLWLSGIVIVVLYLIGMSVYFKKHQYNRKIALIGVFAALMLVAMSVELVPIGYHLNLAVLTGIILGPVYSVISVFIVTLLLALLGHGGITIVGLNTITISIEAICGYIFFRLFNKSIKNTFFRTFLATVIALFFSTMATIGIVYLGTSNIERMMHSHESKHSSILDFRFLSSENNHQDKGSHDHDLEHDHDHDFSLSSSNKDPALSKEHEQPSKGKFDIKRFILLILIFGLIGWVIEGLITAFIVNYIHKIKPDLLEQNQ
jgi:cobalt/nickel transport system permease protein